MNRARMLEDNCLLLANKASIYSWLILCLWLEQSKEQIKVDSPFSLNKAKGHDRF